MDYKDTLNLPKTKFSMKANLPQREPQTQKFWDEMDIYSCIQKAAKGKPKYIVHDGPPYANGNIHIGHALNKTLKDIIIKYKILQGKDSPYVPGWDCHGLPVEHQLFKELGIEKHEISQVEFRKKAHKYAMKFVEIQKEEFKRLGVFGRWNRPYLTLDYQYEEAVIRLFALLVEKGYIYNGLKPVNWCYGCETALAEAEVEYQDKVSPSVYVKFKLKEQDNSFILIWTTTPWTLIANAAVTVHPDLDYVVISNNGDNLILAKSLLDTVAKNCSLGDYTVVKTMKGSELEGKIYEHPFGLREGKVVLAEYVSREEGTGCVHTAPGHGQEDYLTGQKYGLETVMPVDETGAFKKGEAGEFSGMNVHKADEKIIERLKEKGSLIHSAAVTHSYPHCWRCKKPIIVRATKQWFMQIDKNSLRQRLLKLIKDDVRWVPAQGQERISSMVQNRPDWCLSRQRYWGVPIPVFECRSCKRPICDAKLINHFAGIVAKDGTNAWFEKDAKQLVPEGYKCPDCQSQDLKKGEDIIDVWFESGVSHHAVLKINNELSYPADLYLEGSDQHRGWFQSALITAVGADETIPFKTVLTHGFVVDGEGRKMSKSIGNVITPQEIIKDYGADILRLWVASCNYNEDIRISGQILTRLAEAYRKIRNTARFILGNLFDFDPEKDKVDYNKFLPIDKWAFLKLQELIKETDKYYESFQFHKVYRAAYDF
ncbi:MAG TPA: isoleucine--tRNA ligase, partial [Candidatus Omnitrophica bacterium]|nr:isoleucine--tRNA ligase [Candidatus Omnitrophota bacterium]